MSTPFTPKEAMSMSRSCSAVLTSLAIEIIPSANLGSEIKPALCVVPPEAQCLAFDQCRYRFHPIAALAALQGIPNTRLTVLTVIDSELYQARDEAMTASGARVARPFQ